MKSGPTNTTNAQHKRFIETARALECDADKERFEEKLGKIAKAKPAKSAPKLKPRFKMIARLSATVIMLLLAFAAAFRGYSLGFALMCLFFAAVTWFKWEIICDGFAAAKGESQMPIIRLSANMMGGLANMFRGDRPHRRSPSSNA